MQIEDSKFHGLKIIIPTLYQDTRGFFFEPYNRNEYFDTDFVQDGHSKNIKKGTIRGLHFQIPPYAQVLLVRVIRGAILDVVVDLRKKSTTFGEYLSIELSEENRKQLMIPIGFAHGFCTLTNDTEVCYKMSNYYKPEYDKGILWDDRDLNIDWPVTKYEVVTSDRDKSLAMFSELPDYFIELE